MKTYLVGHKQAEFKDKEFCIVNARDDKEAIFKYGLHIGHHEKWFLENITHAGWGSFAGQFWDISAQAFAECTPSEQEAAIERFESNARKFFVPYPEWTDFYLAICREARMSDEWEVDVEFPPRMLAAMYTIQNGKDCITFDVTEIQVSE